MKLEHEVMNKTSQVEAVTIRDHYFGRLYGGWTVQKRPIYNLMKGVGPVCGDTRYPGTSAAPCPKIADKFSLGLDNPM